MRKNRLVVERMVSRGKFHLLADSKSAGKSTIACDLMATIAVGGKWPDGIRRRWATCWCGVPKISQGRRSLWLFLGSLAAGTAKVRHQTRESCKKMDLKIAT
jgi:hypothetical protein